MALFTAIPCRAQPAAPESEAPRAEARALWVTRFDYDSEAKIARIMETAARALEILKRGREARVSQVRTGLALGAYESEAKIDFQSRRAQTAGNTNGAERSFVPIAWRRD